MARDIWVGFRGGNFLFPKLEFPKQQIPSPSPTVCISPLPSLPFRYTKDLPHAQPIRPPPPFP